MGAGLLLGYEKIALFGVSYGTRMAQACVLTKGTFEGMPEVCKQ